MSAFRDTAKKSAFDDVHQTCAPQLETETSTFRDVAAFSGVHKRSASAGAYIPDKFVCGGAAASRDLRSAAVVGCAMVR